MFTLLLISLFTYLSYRVDAQLYDKSATDMSIYNYRVDKISKILRLINDRAVVSVDLVKSLVGDVFHPLCVLKLGDKNETILGEYSSIHAFYKLGFNTIPAGSSDVTYEIDYGSGLKHWHPINSHVSVERPIVEQDQINQPHNDTIHYSIEMVFDSSSNKIVFIHIQHGDRSTTTHFPPAGTILTTDEYPISNLLYAACFAICILLFIIFVYFGISNVVIFCQLIYLRYLRGYTSIYFDDDDDNNRIYFTLSPEDLIRVYDINFNNNTAAVA